MPNEVNRFMAPGPWITRDLKECVLASDFDATRALLHIAITLAYRASRDLYRGAARNSDYDREADITAQIDKMCRDYPVPTAPDAGAEHG